MMSRPKFEHAQVVEDPHQELEVVARWLRVVTPESRTLSNRCPSQSPRGIVESGPRVRRAGATEVPAQARERWRQAVVDRSTGSPTCRVATWSTCNISNT